MEYWHIIAAMMYQVWYFDILSLDRNLENLSGMIQRVNKKLCTGIDYQNIHIHNLEELSFKMMHYTTGYLSDLISQIYIEKLKEWYFLACNYDPLDQRVKG